SVVRMLIHCSSMGSGGHSPGRHHSLVLPPAPSHWAWVISLKPRPLHSPWPLQEVLAVMQAFWPSQPLTPKHFPSPVWASCIASAGRVLRRVAAIRARAAPVTVLDFVDMVMISLGGIGAGRAWPVQGKHRHSCRAYLSRRPARHRKGMGRHYRAGGTLDKQEMA